MRRFDRADGKRIGDRELRDAARSLGTCSFRVLCQGVLSLSLAACSEQLRTKIWTSPSGSEGGMASSVQKGLPTSPDVRGGQRLAGSSNNKANDQNAPLTATVAQAFYVDNQLQVKVRLQAKASLPAEDVVVTIVGLKEGQVIETHDQTVSDVIQKKLFYKSANIIVPFVLTSQELTEFQIQCRWGDDAIVHKLESSAHGARAMAPTEQAISPQDLEEKKFVRDVTAEAPVIIPSSGEVSLQDVEIETDESACADSKSCDIHYVLRAKVLNESGRELKLIELAVGFAWGESNSLPKPPARGLPKQPGEELVQLQAVNLGPGGSKKLKIKIDRGVPVVPGGAFIPYIRIVKSEF